MIETEKDVCFSTMFGGCIKAKYIYTHTYTATEKHIIDCLLNNDSDCFHLLSLSP